MRRCSGGRIVNRIRGHTGINSGNFRISSVAIRISNGHISRNSSRIRISNGSINRNSDLISRVRNITEGNGRRQQAPGTVAGQIIPRLVTTARDIRTQIARETRIGTCIPAQRLRDI